PGLRPGREAFAAIIHFSRNLFGSKLLIYLTGQVDNAAVGTLGETRLGWYAFGENQSATVVVGVGATVAQIALPALAAARDHLPDLRQIYLNMLRLTATISTPMQVGGIVIAELAVVLFFGEQWRGSVTVFQAYLTFRLLDTLVRVADATVSAVGRTEVRFRVDLIQLPFFLVGVYLGVVVFESILSVAWTLTLVRTTAAAIYFTQTLRLTDLKPGVLWRYLLPSTLASALMGLSVWGLYASGWLFERLAFINGGFWQQMVLFVLLVAVGGLLYFSLLILLDRRGFTEVFLMAWEIVLPEGPRRQIDARWRRLRNQVPWLRWF
ncbi:MAG: oligosaccharide flippase family protein, partial [Chloroflexi bacterium]|nr:oligosaccharide flippase family protein [Chloroflexota bacterium]